ncbi:MAG: hypothetical protein KUG51_00875 [Urechidicola sp.]|nr:hypothetical protein [Urechidicola sp.]
MKKTIFVLGLLLFTSFMSVGQENWSKFSSETGKFSVSTLGDISESVRETEKTTSFKINIIDGTMSYMISSTLHASDLESDIDNLLNTSINSFNESIKGVIISQQDVERDGSKGIYADVKISEGAVKLEYFVFINGFYQYQVMAYAVNESYDEDNANRFFRSFKILE